MVRLDAVNLMIFFKMSSVNKKSNVFHEDYVFDFLSCLKCLHVLMSVLFMIRVEIYKALFCEVDKRTIYFRKFQILYIQIFVIVVI